MNKLDKNAQIGVFAEYLLSVRHDFLKMKRYKHATIENLTSSISINTSSIERILVELNLQHMKNLVFFLLADNEHYEYFYSHLGKRQI